MVKLVDTVIFQITSLRGLWVRIPSLAPLCQVCFQGELIISTLLCFFKCHYVRATPGTYILCWDGGTASFALQTACQLNLKASITLVQANMIQISIYILLSFCFFVNSLTFFKKKDKIYIKLAMTSLGSEPSPPPCEGENKNYFLPPHLFSAIFL